MHKPIISVGVLAAVIGLGAFAYVDHGSPGPSSSGLPSEVFTGYVTDLRCKQNVDAECNRQCLAAGQGPALLLDGTGEIVRLKNAKKAKEYPGTHVEGNRIRENDVIVVSTTSAK